MPLDNLPERVTILANVQFDYNIPPGAQNVHIHAGDQLYGVTLFFNAGDSTFYDVWFGFNKYHCPPGANSFSILGPLDFEAVIAFDYDVEGTGPAGLQGPVGPQGSVGPAGPQGATGPAGPTGPMGPQGSSGPAGAQGQQGNTGQTGPTGLPGADGNTILSGAGAPTSGLGDPGDFYIDTSTGRIYGPKVGTNWGSGTSMVGPAGPQGPQGIQGPQGATGNTGSQGPAGTPGFLDAVINFIIDGGGQVISTGLKGFVEVPAAMTINRWTLLADVSGSIVVDVWKDTYANAPPTVADVITASAKPTISSAQKNQSATLTGWTTTLNAGDILAFNVNSVTSITRCTISLKCTKI